MSSIQEIFDAAQALSSGERAWLIHALWDTVESEDWIPPSEEWLTEAQHRSNQLDAGQMAVASWTDVRNRVRRQVGLDG